MRTSFYKIGRRTAAGFTLIEIMIVVVIIGILAGMSTLYFVDKLHEGRVQGAKAQIKTFRNAITMFEIDTGRVPSSDEGLDVLLQKTANNRRYLDAKEIPVDPWGNPYVYQAPGEDEAVYDISSLGADGKPGGAERDADIIDQGY